MRPRIVHGYEDASQLLLFELTNGGGLLLCLVQGRDIRTPSIGQPRGLNVER
jgi:hypothetical protein